jgi:outer membrane lipoprotein-sorting protein
VAIVDGDRTSLYLAADRQLVLGRLADEGDLLPTLLAGRRPLGEIFEASVDEARADGACRLALRPPGPAEPVERVVITLRPPEFAIEAVEVRDAAGNRMDYRFTARKRNAGVPPGAFRFEPPPGTEVSGSHDPSGGSGR